MPVLHLPRAHRAYLHYLSRAEELTGARLMAVHNLTFVARLVAEAREAIAAGAYEPYARAVLGGAAPWEARARFESARRRAWRRGVPIIRAPCFPG